MVLTTTLRLLAAAVDDNVRGALHLPPRYLAVYGKPGEAFFTDPALAENFARLEAANTSWQIASLHDSYCMRLGTAAGPSNGSLRLRRSFDRVCDQQTRQGEGRARSHLSGRSFGHFDLYHGDAFGAVVADQIAFLCEHLASGPGKHG
jgi:hypothetical protein